MKQNLAFLFLKILPRNLISRVVGRLVSIALPYPFSLIIVDLFARYYRINTQEAELELAAYPSIQAFFTRRLKPGLRPIKGALVHPADARITSHGPIAADEIIQTKGVRYSLKTLVGENIDAFIGGYYITYYLCPTDYHRVHVPGEFHIQKVRFIPGDLWPVNEESVLKVPGLFALNERVVAVGNDQSLALVMVGATNVGQIKLSFMDEVSNIGGAIREFSVSQKLSVGDEFGIFNMGSTVIALFGPSYSVGEVKSGPVRLGERLPQRATRELTH